MKPSLGFLMTFPKMGKGDWMPFIIAGVAVVLSFPFTNMMSVVALGWCAFVTLGLLRSFGRQLKSVMRFICMLWIVLNIPTALIAAVSYWYW